MKRNWAACQGLLTYDCSKRKKNGGKKQEFKKRETDKSRLLGGGSIEKEKKIYLMSRYRAEILCIFFNTKHFRSVLYWCYFAFTVFKVNLVMKLQRKEHKSSQSTAHRKKAQCNKYASIMFKWTQPLHSTINNLLKGRDGVNWYGVTIPELCLWNLTPKRQE